MGQSSSSTTNYNTTNVVSGDNNSVIPTSTDSNAMTPSQSISPSASLSMAEKAEADLNPSDCSMGKASTTNNYQGFLQSLCAISKSGLSHISAPVNRILSISGSAKDSVDKTLAVSTGTALTIAQNLSKVVRDASVAEIASKLRMLVNNGGTTGIMGGIYKISDPDLQVEQNTTIERIHSTPDETGVSPAELAHSARNIINAFKNVRRAVESLSTPIGTAFSPNSKILGEIFSGLPYPFIKTVGDKDAGIEVPPGEEVTPSESSQITSFAITLTVHCETDDLTKSPVVNAHATNKLSSAIDESGPFRFAGATSSGYATYVCTFILNRKAISFDFPPGVSPFFAEFRTSVLDATNITLNIPADRVDGMAVTPKTTGLDTFGRILDAGASTGPGDIRDIWHAATMQVAPFVTSMTAHPSFPSVITAVTSELQRYVSTSSTALSQLAEDMITQLPLYPYKDGPIGRMLALGVGCRDAHFIALVCINFMENLATEFAAGRNPASIRYASVLATIAASRSASNCM